MGIYINIEMPRTHPITLDIYPDGTVLSKTVGRRDIHGTAVPVPPHGDLIDRDALQKKRHWTDDFYETEYVEVEDIDSAPTIIPASE